MSELWIGEKVKIDDPLIQALLYKYGKKDMSRVWNIERAFEDRQWIIDERDRILMALVGNSMPVESIMKSYDSASDKDIFVAALADALLMRHKQWQASSSANKRK